MKIDFVKYLKLCGFKVATGLTGFQGWLVNLIINRVWKKLYPAIKAAWGITMDKLRDNKLLKNYANEMAKGKDASDEALHDQQDSILNPHKPKPK